MPTAPYIVASHIHFCIHGEHLVFLNLTKGKYQAIEVERAAGVGGWIEKWPVSQTAPADPELLDELVADGILEANSGGHRHSQPIEVPTPQSALVDIGGISMPEIRLRDILQFCSTVLWALNTLHRHDVRHVVQRIRLRDLHRQRGSAFDFAKARTFISVFNRLRPFVFNRRDACLLYSLALREFLARNGVPVALVFGVQMGPFRAHCWLQHEGLVLNDTPHMVACFTPIMSV